MKISETIQPMMVNHLLALCKKEMKIDNLPPIDFVEDPFIQGGEKKSFGEFDGKSIRVVVKDRHPIDIMRTLSHEITHWKQRISGMPMDGSDGSETENQANAIAGVIMRKFGEMYPNYFIDSMPQ